MTQTITKTITIKTIEEAKQKLETEYPNGIDLIYVDYRDSFDENLKPLQGAIQANDLYLAMGDDPIEWGEYEAIDYILKEHFTEEELNYWRENDEIQELYDFLQENDTSNPAKDLLKNTGKQMFFYDLNCYIEANDYSETEKDAKRKIAKIAKKLKIDPLKYKEELTELVANAYYGGNLCILFYTDPAYFFTDDGKENMLWLTDPHVCIMDRTGGSGHDVQLKTEIKLPFNRKNLFLDKATAGYSYAYDVCGLYCPAYETHFNLAYEPKTKKPQTNANLHADQDKYAGWDADLKKGICHFEDHRFKSHDTIYINNFPCGNKCQKCGRFFID